MELFAAAFEPSIRPELSRHVEAALARDIVGQVDVLERVLISLLAGGHVLLEGVPGLAKTRLVRSLARALHADFRRIQFTPDLLPSDIVGTMVLRRDGTGFGVARGPIFANIVLADEVNRAPAKVQSALLEAMEERQVTLGGRTLELPDPFMVLATQNPLEQQGTYPLAEAQLDRFLMKLRVTYPPYDDEVLILRRAAEGDAERGSPVATTDDVLEARASVARVRVDDRIIRYAVALARATREPAGAGLSELGELLECGASPRAAIGLVTSARAMAWMRGRPFVLPEDVKALVPDVFRHRLMLTYKAETQGVDSDAVLERILDSVPIP